jgi:hypothetical protein
VLDNADMPPSLVAPMLRVVEMLESWFDAAAWVALHRAEEQARGAHVRVERTPDKGQGKCPLESGVRGFGVAGVVCSFLGCL